MPKQLQTSWVDLIEWDPMTKSGFTVVRAYLEDGVVQFDGDKIVVEKLQKGIGEVQSSDGLKFLKAMTTTFRNPYLLATEVRTGILPKDFGSVEMNIVSVE